jgi:hypothetical protein
VAQAERETISGALGGAGHCQCCCVKFGNPNGRGGFAPVAQSGAPLWAAIARSARDLAPVLEDIRSGGEPAIATELQLGVRLR